MNATLFDDIDCDINAQDEVVNKNQPVVKKTSLNRLFDSFISMQAEIAAARQKHAALENELLGEAPRSRDDVSTLKDYACLAVDALFWNASRKYSVSGAPLIIDQKQEMVDLCMAGWEERYWALERSAKRFDAPHSDVMRYPVDLQKIADHFEKKFGNGFGARIANQQQARLIAKYFDLDSAPLKTNSRGIVLTRNIYLQKDKWSGVTTYEIHYNHKEDLRKLHFAFLAFARQLDLIDFEYEINTLFNELGEYKKYKLPVKWDFKTIHMKLFTDKFELTLERSVAAKLQLYLGEFLH